MGYSPPPEESGVGLPRPQKPLTEMTELEYARFCRKFERAVTVEILKRDPQDCVVLSNDISEGPDFSVLGERGYRIVTIFHVDVVEYFTKFYLGGLVKPETAARFRWFALLPNVLRLVFQKQLECVRHSTRIVVPSAPMRETILRCYPWCESEKIVVLPWGDVTGSTAAGKPLLPWPEIADDEFVILTLSRLSPEKGIERLLAALPRVKTSGGRLRVIICGGAAFMKGRAYERKLRQLAATIANARVEFTGHVSGETNTALLLRADLFVSPSRHESYGLTIAEALAAGCRVISHPHYGAGGLLVDCSDPVALAATISAMVTGGRTPKTGAVPPPTQAAAQLAALLAIVAGRGSARPGATV
jgi:glycosyltransferase involved in cell wall biosynthesis